MTNEQTALIIKGIRNRIYTERNVLISSIPELAVSVKTFGMDHVDYPKLDGIEDLLAELDEQIGVLLNYD